MSFGGPCKTTHVPMASKAQKKRLPQLPCEKGTSGQAKINNTPHRAHTAVVALELQLPHGW
eukprot:5790046-Prymnesium_polylepis.1